MLAFWAMHVEAMNWSGMSVREYPVDHFDELLPWVWKPTILVKS